ncbi:MAG: molybdopterin biosynthesis protein [Candidatus Pelagibacter sp. TMED166]|nr:MAG: molybdopterin biosynthesis protein [Candidatus Pelagibacter sp. TMED166]|tara:strand:- start:5535 stop:6290 length:756 start_codon:yes stop_codon:yes gene_type:complete
MNKKYNNNFFERYSRQIILKDIGFKGQQLLNNSKVLIVGLGGLGCPVADYLTRSGVGTIGIADFDKVSLSNLHRQTFFDVRDIGKFKVEVVKEKLNKINPNIKITIFKKKIEDLKPQNIIKKFDIIVDGTDNFKSKLVLNKLSFKFKKKFIVGAISKFNGHIFTFDFTKKNEPCLKCFYQDIPSDEILNCEQEGVIGPVAGVVGCIQSNEVLRKILKIGKCEKGKILIIDLLKMTFKNSKFNRKKNCVCEY